MNTNNIQLIEPNHVEQDSQPKEIPILVVGGSNRGKLDALNLATKLLNDSGKFDAICESGQIEIKTRESISMKKMQASLSLGLSLGYRLKDIMIEPLTADYDEKPMPPRKRNEFSKKNFQHLGKNKHSFKRR